MMNLNLPQIIFSKIFRAVVEFELIDDGDKILIGVSGGKFAFDLRACLPETSH